MKLGKEVGLGPGHIVLDEHPAPLPKGAQPQFFDPCLFWPNDRMDQMTTWYGGRPRPRPHCVKWGFSSLYKRATAPPIFGDQLPLPKGHIPQFSADVYCGQMAGWINMPLGIEVDLGPSHNVLDGDLPPKNGAKQPPLFGPRLLWPNDRPSQLLLSTC